MSIQDSLSHFRFNQTCEEELFGEFSPMEEQGPLYIDVIVKEIFSYLPLDSVEKCRLVNRQWRIYANAELKCVKNVFGCVNWKSVFGKNILIVPPLTFQADFIALMPRGLDYRDIFMRAVMNEDKLDLPDYKKTNFKVHHSYWVGYSKQKVGGKLSLMRTARCGDPKPYFEDLIAAAIYRAATGKLLIGDLSPWAVDRLVHAIKHSNLVELF